MRNLYNFALPVVLVGIFMLWGSNRTPSESSQISDFGFRISENLGDTTMTDAQKRLPENAVKNLTVAEGLNAQLFASEPTISNPTNMDIDDKGRVWVLEAYNYRPAINGNPTKKEGDRILILEDTNGDGIADKNKVFYQGAEIESPLGIWVMGNKVIVSQSPYVWLFTDDNGDDKADRKEILLQGIKGEQHDHGMHAFVFGPDGKFYFNFGNAGEQLLDRNGKPIVDKDGKEISLKNYKQGMVFRCNPDMTDFEVLGHNFRNNYEVCVDSYGNMWQSDNDDDGNKGVRINYVMDYGNYGYTDEMTGAGWQVNRTNIEKEIPHRHWHLNDPGVVPNLLQTGAGSPCGIVIYEGNLLPKQYRNQVIHADAGPNVVRAYPVQNRGAGYTAKMDNILKGDNDQWFRPSDVCVAPDGSLFVADWYDPGVGGHQAGDQNRGRIFRVAPNNTPYKIPTYDYSNTEGALKALENPNLSIRWKAWTTLHNMGEKAETALANYYNNATDSRMKARAFWLLAKGKNGAKHVEMAAKGTDNGLKMAAVKAARQGCADVIATVKMLKESDNPQVLRECALALRHHTSPEAPQLWADLAMRYDGADRWYLEALGIGADKQWDSYLGAWLKTVGNPVAGGSAYHDIVWRSRGEAAPALLAALAADSKVPLENRLRYLRAFDFNKSPNKSAILATLVKENGSSQPELVKTAMRHLEADYVKSNPEIKSILRTLMANAQGNDYMELADRYQLPEENARLFDMIQKSDNNRKAADVLLKNTEGVKLFKATIADTKKEAEAIKLLGAVRGIGGKIHLDMLQAAAFDKKRSMLFRQRAMEYLGGSWGGEDLVLNLLKNNKIDKALIPNAVQGVSRAWRMPVRIEASKYLLGNGSKTGRAIPAIPELLKMEGNAAKGIKHFENYCSNCHQVNDNGTDYGPKLSEIGSKLPKEGQYLAILYPNAGISFGYEGWQLSMKDGSGISGIIASRTENEWMVKMPDGSLKGYAVKNMKKREQMTNSLMPSNFQDVMKDSELADLVAYLMTLKK